MLILNLKINDEGNFFYKRWKKDTTLSAFIAAPGLLVFYVGCVILIYDISWRLFFISIWPVFLTLYSFVYSSYFLRKRYINNIINILSIADNVISIETFRRFTYRSISLSVELDNIKLKKLTNEGMFKERTVFVVKGLGTEGKSLYLVEDFFDDFNILLSTLPKS